MQYPEGVSATCQTVRTKPERVNMKVKDERMYLQLEEYLHSKCRLPLMSRRLAHICTDYPCPELTMAESVQRQYEDETSSLI